MQEHHHPTLTVQEHHHPTLTVQEHHHSSVTVQEHYHPTLTVQTSLLLCYSAGTSLLLCDSAGTSPPHSKSAGTSQSWSEVQYNRRYRDLPVRSEGSEVQYKYRRYIETGGSGRRYSMYRDWRVWSLHLSSPTTEIVQFDPIAMYIWTRITNSLVHCFPLLPGTVANQS